MADERAGQLPVILLPESLRHVLGEAASRDLVKVLNFVAGVSQDRILERMDQRFAEVQAKLDQAVAGLREEMRQMGSELEARLREEMREMTAGLRGEMKEMETRLRGEIESKVSRTEARLIKWAFAFWASGTTAVLIAILMK